MISAECKDKIEHLYLEMFEKLYVYARSTLKNDALAEEAVQETFQIACSKPDAVCSSPNPQGWLVITLKNVISNTQRNRITATRILTDYISAQAQELAVSEDQVDLELLYANVAELPEYQLIKEMVLEDKSYLELSEARNISIQACRKRVQRAKEVLKRKIKI